MDDSCDCSKCPHHCGGDDEDLEDKKEKADSSAPADDSTDDFSNDENSAGEKVDKLKKAIAALGFKLEDTEQGIRVTM